MNAEMALVRQDRAQYVVFRRGETTLDEQEVRIESVFQRGYKTQSDAAREARIAVVVFGATDLDVALEDRFTVDGVLYRVVAIGPNRDVDTQAEAIAIE
jgi:hypothetical protein